MRLHLEVPTRVRRSDPGGLSHEVAKRNGVGVGTEEHKGGEEEMGWEMIHRCHGFSQMGDRCGCGVVRGVGPWGEGSHVRVLMRMGGRRQRSAALQDASRSEVRGLGLGVIPEMKEIMVGAVRFEPTSYLSVSFGERV